MSLDTGAMCHALVTNINQILKVIAFIKTI